MFWPDSWSPTVTSEPLADYAPPATLVCPCKGLDEELEHNLTALVEQDYPDLEVIFVMASGDDPARAVCERVAARAKRPARVVIAGKPEGRGEKVNNLLAGVAAARAESEVFVFADSDGRPGPRWVRPAWLFSFRLARRSTRTTRSRMCCTTKSLTSS